MNAQLIADPANYFIWAFTLPGGLPLRYGAAEPVLETRRADARVIAGGEALIVQLCAEVARVDVRSIRNSNQFQIVRRKDFPFRVLHFQSTQGFSGAFVQNLKTFLAAGEEITFSPLAQSNDDREQLSAFLG